MPTTTTTTITCIIISPMNPKTSVINAFNDNQANPTWCVLMKWIEGELICTRWPISLANLTDAFQHIVLFVQFALVCFVCLLRDTHLGSCLFLLTFLWLAISDRALHIVFFWFQTIREASRYYPGMPWLKNNNLRCHNNDYIRPWMSNYSNYLARCN